ncbi:MAG: purine-nucleoside phosphorylase [Bacteroidales bacterium]|nr:purine-nucleoside phosphorylase [Bacteroidales bacterium]
MLKKIQEAKQYIEEAAHPQARTAIVLGSGLNGFVHHIQEDCRIPYAAIPHFPVSTVAGHAGNLVFGKLNGQEIMVMQGRFHFYEGYSMQQVTFPIRVMKALGVETVILSNASGGMNPDYRVGDLMLLRDHINFFPEHPLRGKNEDSLGPRFPNMGEVYDPVLLDKAEAAAKAHGLRCHRGVYIGVQGPTLETPAEYQMYRLLGADCVGMSTVPEAIVCRHSGMKCLGLSVITNVFNPLHAATDTHEDILEAGARMEEQLIAVVKDVISR